MTMNVVAIRVVSGHLLDPKRRRLLLLLLMRRSGRLARWTCARKSRHWWRWLERAGAGQITAAIIDGRVQRVNGQRRLRSPLTIRHQRNTVGYGVLFRVAGAGHAGAADATAAAAFVPAAHATLSRRQAVLQDGHAIKLAFESVLALVAPSPVSGFSSDAAKRFRLARPHRIAGHVRYGRFRAVDVQLGIVVVGRLRRQSEIAALAHLVTDFRLSQIRLGVERSRVSLVHVVPGWSSSSITDSI